jgi:transcription elongation factor Elf1
MDGSPCPRCGATFGPEPVFNRFWNEWKQQCGHCQMEWTVEVEAEAESSPVDLAYFVQVECPKCHGTDCPVKSSTPPIRKHKCRDCGHSFKSVQAKLSDIIQTLRNGVKAIGSAMNPF